jgi:transposase-like protein
MKMPYIPDEYKINLAIGLRYEMRKSYRYIGEKLGVHHTTVMRWCKKIAAGEDATVARKYSEEEKQQAIALRMEGLSYRRIGDLLGVNHTTVMRWYKKFRCCG